MRRIHRFHWAATILIFVFTTFPAWIESIWALFSVEPFIPTIAALVGANQSLDFSAVWLTIVTVPVGLFALWLVYPAAKAPAPTGVPDVKPTQEPEQPVEEPSIQRIQRFDSQQIDIQDIQLQPAYVDQTLQRLDGLKAVGVRFRGEGAALRSSKEFNTWIISVDEWRGQVIADLTRLSEARAGEWQSLDSVPNHPFRAINADHLRCLREMEERLQRLEAIIEEFRNR